MSHHLPNVPTATNCLNCKSISFLVLLIFFFNCIYAQEISTDSLETILERAKDEYKRGEYIEAVARLKDALENLETGNKYEIHKHLAFSYTMLNNTEEAIYHFKKVIKNNPKFELDSAEALPEIVSNYEKAKKEIAIEAGACSCFIPGSGQIMKGEEGKGKVIMLASGIGFCTTTVCWLVTLEKRKSYLDLGSDQINKMEAVYNDYNFWHRTSILSSTVFIGIYLYSVLDAVFTKTKIESTKSSPKKRFFYKVNKERVQIGYNIPVY
jgi:tetratricopeptide (TPR) repeat protein